MKKFIWFLTLIWFVVASNMQLIHAEDMRGEIMPKGHIMKNSDDSIFCKTTDKSTEKECYKDLLWDKYITSSLSKTELSKYLTNTLPIYVSNFVIPSGQDIDIKQHSPPNLIFQKSNYPNLISIIKNLN